MLTNPKTKTWPAMQSPSATSFLLPRSLSIPTGKHKLEFPHLTLLSFLLRKELGSSLESSLKSTGSHTKRELKLHLYSSSYTLKKLEDSNTLLSSLPLILSGPTTGKGKSFHARVIRCLFPLMNHKLGKGSSYSHLRILDLFKEF